MRRLQYFCSQINSALQYSNIAFLKRIDMKIKAIQIQLLVFLLSLAPLSFSQTINLNSAASYAIYSTGGAVTNSGTIYKTRVTGNVGTSSDPTLPGFGNIDGKLTNVSNLAANIIF